MMLLDLLHYLDWREEQLFIACVSRMLCSGVLSFARMCSKAGINGKGSLSRLNSCMCKGASNLLILVKFHQLVFIILMHLNLVMGNGATLEWLARNVKFTAVCCLEKQELYQRSLPLFPAWS